MIDDLARSAEVLKNNGIILFPADISWGLGCDATSSEALEKLGSICSSDIRENGVVLMENPALLDRYVSDIPEIAWDLIDISVTPLTLLLSGVRNLGPALMDADRPTAFRFTGNSFAGKLLQRFRRPIAFMLPVFDGESRICDFEDLAPTLFTRADYVVQHGQNEILTRVIPSVIRLGEGGRIDIIKP
jgi:L-threonylcarbamoyladenylate synthase